MFVRVFVVFLAPVMATQEHQDERKIADEGISPLGLFLGELLPTAVSVVFFWLLP